MNNYQKAIESNQTTDFLLGRNDFFILNRDYGDHDISSTYMDFLNHAIEMGERNTFSRIDRDLQLALDHPTINKKDIINILGYIHFYFNYRFVEKKIKTEWAISKELKNKINERIKNMKDDSTISRILSKLSNDFGFHL